MGQQDETDDGERRSRGGWKRLPRRSRRRSPTIHDIDKTICTAIMMTTVDGHSGHEGTGLPWRGADAVAHAAAAATAMIPPTARARARRHPITPRVTRPEDDRAGRSRLIVKQRRAARKGVFQHAGAAIAQAVGV